MLRMLSQDLAGLLGEWRGKDTRIKNFFPSSRPIYFREYLIGCRGRNRRGNVACVSRHNAAVNQPGVRENLERYRS